MEIETTGERWVGVQSLHDSRLATSDLEKKKSTALQSSETRISIHLAVICYKAHKTLSWFILKI